MKKKFKPNRLKLLLVVNPYPIQDRLAMGTSGLKQPDIPLPPYTQRKLPSPQMRSLLKIKHYKDFHCKMFASAFSTKKGKKSFHTRWIWSSLILVYQGLLFCVAHSLLSKSS